MKKLAIVCGSPSSEMLAPFEDPEYEVWVLGNRCQNYPRFDLIFEIHDALEEEHDPRYAQWLVDKNIELIVGESFVFEVHLRGNSPLPFLMRREAAKAFEDQRFTSRNRAD